MLRSNLLKTANEIANRIEALGGRAYYVGGFVRDSIIGIYKDEEELDLDIEVYGISKENLKDILEDFDLEYVNEKFGAFLLKGGQIEVLMPRLEKSIGCGHKDFDITIEPFLSKEEALSRRDFRMNAILQDVLSGEIIDPYDGISDIQNKRIRHIDSSKFIEDPLRALRAARFSASLLFEIDDETTLLCKQMDISSLSQQLVEKEFCQILTKSVKPSIAFENIRNMQKLLPWFNELNLLIGVQQHYAFHPEGDVWVHTMKAIDCASIILSESKKGNLPWKIDNPYEFMLLALTHDFGKVVATEEIDGVFHAYDHENLAMPLIEAFAKRLGFSKFTLRYLQTMVPLHMKPHRAFTDKSSIRSTNKMFDMALSKTDLIYMALADKMWGFKDENFTEILAFMKERLRIYQETMAMPYVTGKDLIDEGITDGEEINAMLKFSHKLRLAGIGKQEALKMTITQRKSICKDFVKNVTK